MAAETPNGARRRKESSTHVGAGNSFCVQSPESSGKLEGASRMRYGTLDTINGGTPVAGIRAPVFSVAILDVV